jgi:hypothetical protein
MSSASLKKDLLDLLSDYQHLLRELLRGRPHLRGSFHQVHTRCGKANCWCARADKGHPHVRLTWSEAGNFITRKVPAAEKDQVAELTDNHRQFREQRRRLTALASQIEECLGQYEKALTEEVRRPLAFLTSSAQLSAQHRRRLQVRGSGRKTSM